MSKPHRTLLVIDDSPDGDGYESQLRQDSTFSYTVLTERYGSQIPAVCRSHPIDGIVLELLPPHSHSLDFLSQLKEQMGETCPPIVVIDSGDAEIAVRALKTGAVDYLVKERMTPDDLRLAVRSAIENTELRQKLQSCQERFQTSVENMLDCFGIFSSIRDRSGQIVDFRIDYLNAAACENNRMPKAMQIGKGLCEVWSAHRETGLFEEYCRVVETGAPLIKESLIYDDNYNGQRLTRAFDIHATKLDDGIVVSWRDVTERKQAELDRQLMLQQVQQSEERLRIAQTAANAGVWDWDIAADRVYWSAEYYTLFGLDPDISSSYTHWLDSLLDDERERVHQITQELLANHQTDVNLEFRIRHPVRGIRWLNAIGQVFYSPSGQAVRMTGITLDITERKQMEAQRSQAEAAIEQLNHDLANRVSELQTLLEVIPIGIAIASEPTCTQMQSNAYIRQLLGISAGVNISKSAPSDEQPPYRVFKAGQEVPAEELPMQIAARLGVDVRDTEFEIVLPDGTTRQILAYAAPLRNDEDEIRGAVGAFLDVTERKQAEAALQAANSRAISIAEAMPQMIWTADATGAVNYFNQHWYEYSGLSEAESMGLAFASAIHPDDRDRTLEQWSQSVARGESFEIEYRVHHWDGLYHWFINRGVPTRDSQGQMTSWIGTITDIDRQKRLEEKLLNEIANHQRTEQELRAANQQITSILERMTDAFVAVDRDWRITYVNQMTARLNQVAPEELIGKSHWQVWAASVGTICEENYRRAIAEQIPVHFDYFYEGRQRWYEIHAYPSPDGLGIYYRDIHDRKQSEVSLRESQAQLKQQLAEIEAIYQTAPIGLNVLDTDLRFVRINQRLAQINGLPVEAHIGRTVREVLPEVADIAEQLLRPILETGEPLLNVEIQAETPAQPGVQRTWLEHFRPLKNGDRVIGISTVCEEITERKRMEAALRQREAELQAALQRLNFHVENSPLAVIEWDRDFRVSRWSKAAERIFGWQAEEMLGKRFDQFKLVFEADAERVTTMVTQLAEGIATQLMLQNRNYTKTGAVIHCEWYNSALHDETGPLSSVLSLVLDVSDRIQAEQALSESAERLATLADNISQLVWMTDEHGRAFWYNRRWFDYTGTTVEEMEGLGWHQVHHPDHLERVTARFRQFLETGEPWEDTFPLRGKDGTYRWFLSRAIPIRDEQGRILRWFGTNTDIDDRRQAEAAVRESEERLRLALRAANQGLYDLNVQTGDAIVSPEYAQMLGYDPESFSETNAKWRERLHPDDVAGVYQVYEDYIAGRRDEYRVEFRQRTKSGDWKWILSVGKIVSWASDGQPLRMLGTHTDISDRKAAEAQREQLLEREQAAREAAEQANRLKDEFLAVLSHELRTPLNPILGWVKLLQARQFSAAQIQQALATIERNVRLQLQLIDDLLDSARIIRGKLVLHQEPVSLSGVIAAAAETVRLSMEAQSIHLEIEQICDVQLISGDAGRLQQVIGNLLSNAVKFTPKNGRVTVRLEQVGNQAQIQVIDTGKGIKPDFLPYIFELFRQQDSSTTRQFGGLGLGLAISRQVVEMHGGTITADSPGEGLGATFTVRLPLMAVTQPPSPAPVVKGTMDLQGVRVLAVDDEPDSLELIEILLEQEGAIVTTASSAQQALQALAQSQFDVLISDIGMPEMDGYVLLHQIRMLPPEQGGDIFAIALTAYAGESDRQQVLAADYQIHLPKPIDLDRLIAAIHLFK